MEITRVRSSGEGVVMKGTLVWVCREVNWNFVMVEM